MRSHSSRRILPIIAVTALATGAGPCFAATVLFAEDFNSVTLTASPTYGVPNAYSPVPPPGWDVSNSLPPGGVPEWRGWAMARKSFWQAVGAASGDAPGREQFTRGSGTIAVADPDLWNSPQIGQTGDPANRGGFFYSFLHTPVIDLDDRPAAEDRLTLAFDSSWLSLNCCDDGDYLDPPLFHRNNQTAVVRARVNGGAPIELLRWESAPYYDGNGFPTMMPMSLTGAPNTPNPFYRRFALDERVFIDLAALLSPAPTIAGGATRLKGDIQIEFAVENAGDDGWWAVDNIEMTSYATLLGDMNFSGDLDQGDYDAFALGMLDTQAYRIDFWGAYPVENGSLDSTFDFDDIPWFLEVMKDVGAPASAYAQAFFAIPEPTGAALSLIAMLSYAARRRPG
ncbi:hypothetical protein [Botrimarina mediterranea]|uniref:PEP-CTERM protein-sorting domain-containing protein n=1 Tax=Botrimarina mediterranea TaxID=2528022 RepID=A0A518KBQ2_9BACT|nr:hypothetical protein [Botrimarina mediterranea]QDV75223.1 hypothetical protein Spa11_34370 [Botrimarina mediterranea]QDV79892.1 hypothetical protein K2D_35120 [Planctomycetes bacterium K2D]